MLATDINFTYFNMGGGKCKGLVCEATNYLSSGGVNVGGWLVALPDNCPSEQVGENISGG